MGSFHAGYQKLFLTHLEIEWHSCVCIHDAEFCLLKLGRAPAPPGQFFHPCCVLSHSDTQSNTFLPSTYEDGGIPALFTGALLFTWMLSLGPSQGLVPLPSLCIKTHLPHSVPAHWWTVRSSECFLTICIQRATVTTTKTIALAPR